MHLVLISNKISVEDDKIIIAEIFMHVRHVVRRSALLVQYSGTECLVHQSRRT